MLSIHVRLFKEILEPPGYIHQSQLFFDRRAFTIQSAIGLVLMDPSK